MSRRSDTFAAYDVDDALIATAVQEATPGFSVYRATETMVVLGRGSRADRELNCDACVADGVPVLRRRGGGCAVVLDPGNVIVSVALPVGGIKDNLRYLQGISRWIARGLESCGVPDVELAGISDLAIAGRKISGSCVYRGRNVLYYSASLLVDADLEKLDRYLAHPPREPGYREGRMHSEFATRISDNADLTAAQLARFLDTKLNETSAELAICAS